MYKLTVSTKRDGNPRFSQLYIKRVKTLEECFKAAETVTPTHTVYEIRIVIEGRKV